jgi:hypothetical protein
MARIPQQRSRAGEDVDELGINAQTRKHMFREVVVIPSGKEKWEHRLTKGSSALDSVPPVCTARC